MPVFLSGEVAERQGKEIEAYGKDLYLREYIGARAFPRVRDLSLRIRASGQHMVLASSAKGDEPERYKMIAGIADLLDTTASAEAVEHSKPCPDIFLAAPDRLAPLGAADAFVVDDTPYDAEAAAKAGLRTVGVRCGGLPEADPRAAGCVAIYRGPADLLASYDRSPLAPVRVGPWAPIPLPGGSLGWPTRTIRAPSRT